jgi:hypothetical protein
MASPRDGPVNTDGAISPRDFAANYVTATQVTPYTSTQVQVRERSNSSLAPEQRRELQNKLQGLAQRAPAPAPAPGPADTRPAPAQVPSLDLNPFGFVRDPLVDAIVCVGFLDCCLTPQTFICLKRLLRHRNRRRHSPRSQRRLPSVPQTRSSRKFWRVTRECMKCE